MIENYNKFFPYTYYTGQQPSFENKTNDNDKIDFGYDNSPKCIKANRQLNKKENIFINKVAIYYDGGGINNNISPK